MDLDVSLFAYAECSVGGLRFDGGVPPQVVMDDLRCGGEVESGAACLERKNEHFAVWVALVVLDHFGALCLRASAVVKMRAESEFRFDGRFEEVAHFGELREDERLFALVLDGREQVQEHLHLARFEFFRMLDAGIVTLERSDRVRLSSLVFRFAQVPTIRLGHAQLCWSRLSP